MAVIKRTKEINMFRVMRSIWVHRTTSRIEIAKNLKLDKSTITNIVSELLSIDLVREANIGEAGPQGGRKPVYLTVNREFGRVVGIEIQPETYTVVVVNMSGEILYSDSGQQFTTGDNLVDVFLMLLERTIGRLDPSGPPVIGVGVGVSGIINQRDGKIVLSIPLGISTEFDFLRAVSGKVDIPVFLENDANCCAWGELAFHRTERLKNFIFALVEFRKGKTPKDFYKGIALGLGIVLGGRVYYGEDFSAGEFRSVFWQETNAGQFSLNDTEMLMVEDNAGVRARFIDELSKNIALFVNTFNLNRVYLGGDIEKYEHEIKPVLDTELRRNWSYPTKVNCEIAFSSHGSRSVAYGAAGMFLGQIFTHNYPDEANDSESLSGIQLIPAFVNRTGNSAFAARNSQDSY
jgi:predicted NBD/HSP70 family sugar kinase